MTDSKRIVFAGTPEFSVPPLRALLASGHKVVGVYSQPDRPAGRGRKLTPGPVKEVRGRCRHPGFPAGQLQRPGGRSPSWPRCDADLMVVVAYGLLLPRAVLDAPRLGCVNIHASVLPRWRGAAPIQRAVLAGDAVSGVTIMQMEEGLDTGPMYLVEEVALSDRRDRRQPARSAVGARRRGVDEGPAGDPRRHPRATDAGRCAGLLCEETRQGRGGHRLDNSRPPTSNARCVHSTPGPSRRRCSKTPICASGARYAVKGVGGAPGMVMNADRNGIDVATGDGLLRVTELQLPGKRAMAARDFINANSIQGTVLGPS